MSDHPASESRIRDIRREAEELGCSIELGDQSEWRSFMASLPPVKEDEPDEVAEEPESD